MEITNANYTQKKAEGRLRKMQSLRLQIQENPLITQKSTHLIQKLQKAKQIRKKSEQILTIQGQSVSQLDEMDQRDETVESLSSFVEKYEVLEKLGQGGNGCVYKCRHRKNEKFYAVKKFRHEEEHILELKKNFIFLKQLHHSLIIQYRALYFDPKQRCTYLVMEYFNHPSLAEVVIQDEQEIITITKEILEALKYIHDRNICHRDIKPENILYSQKDRQIKLIDFGISKRTYQRGSRRDMLTIIGTQFYLAPEVYIGGGYDERIDLWALGVTIYKLITGVTPFESEYNFDTIANILRGQAKYQQHIWDRYSFFAKDFVFRFLKYANKRITLSQAQKHLWLKNSTKCNKIIRMRRSSSDLMQISQDFHNQMNNKVHFAKCKQQGENKEEFDLPFLKTVNLVNQKQYDLQDSDDQGIIISPFFKSINQHSTFTSLSSNDSFFLQPTINHHSSQIT